MIVPLRSAATRTRPHGGETELQDDTEGAVHEDLAPLWRVICHDDPITTMDFVVEVLVAVFRITTPRALELMMRVHRTGAAVVGRWPEPAARRKAERARAKARAAGFPLTFTVERDA